MQAEYKQYKYKVVNLQKLQNKQQMQTTSVSLQNLIKQLNPPSSMMQFYRGKTQKVQLDKLYCYKDTAVDDKRITSQYHNFFNAFYIPYNQHGDVFLVPDDIWLMISLYLSKYIDSNSEKLRNHFVNHEGQKQLTIVQYPKDIEQSLKMEKQWDYFFAQIIKQIQKNTKQDIVEALSCNFTTTDKVYKLISTSIIMSSLQSYFTYGRKLMLCGLSNIYFAGTYQDWVKVLSKLKNLQKYDVDGNLKKYITHIQIIINQFIDTFNEKPDVKWWNTIMTSQERRVGSGGQKDTYIQGWILHFFGIYQPVEINKIPKTSIKVPIKLENHFTKTQKKLQLIADWISVSKVNQTTYKPDIGVCIMQREAKQLS